MIRQLLTKKRHQEYIAIIDEYGEHSYIDLLKKARKVQFHLSQEQQKIISILLPNSFDYISALWGIFMTGMTAYPLNVMMTSHELLILLEQASVRTIITTSVYGYIFEEINEFCNLSLKIIFIDELDDSPLEQKGNCNDTDSNKPMLMLNTSGTSGNIKIVQLTEKNVEVAVFGYLDKLCYDKTKSSPIRYILAAPFSSVYGIMIISACLLQSFPIIVTDQGFTLNTFYQLVEKHKVTHYEGSTSIVLLMAQMADRAIPYDIHTLMYVGFGGSRISGSIIEKLLIVYPDIEFYQGYGMTEASPLITKHPQKKLLKTQSVGTVIKGVTVAIEIDGIIDDTPYVIGEILVKGSNIMMGYFCNKHETNQVLKNGYLYTGDIGYLDEEGYLYICGRKKNIIIVRGFNVYPEEIEACIQNSQLAKDSFVYGQMGDDGSEILCADIVPMHSQISEDDIRMYCSIHLAIYKRPQKIKLCKNICKNTAGKTLRFIEGLPGENVI